MFDENEVRNTTPLEAVVHLSDGSEVFGMFFATPKKRLSDLLNDERDFLPIGTTNGTVTVVRKAAIVRVTPTKQNTQLEVTDPYEILGVRLGVTFEDLRKAYHGQVRQYHPDQIARYELPQPFIDFATAQMARINDAFQRVCKEKGFNEGQRAKDPVVA